MRSILCNRIMMGATMLSVMAFAATSIEYHLANTYKFGAAPGAREYFDYMTFDPDSHRLYLSHGSEVLVVNADTGKEEGKISGLKASHGVALVPAVGRGFISDGAQGKAIIFDLKTLKVTGEATAAPDADCIIYDPASKHVLRLMATAKMRPPSIQPAAMLWARLIWVAAPNSPWPTGKGRFTTTWKIRAKLWLSIPTA